MYSIRQDHPLDVDNGDGKSWSSSFSLRLVCVGKGFEDKFSDNSDLLKMVRRVFLTRSNNPTYENLIFGLYDSPCKRRFPSQCR
jgi:hypothetical protein